MQSKLDSYWSRRARGYNLVTLLSLKDTKFEQDLINSILPPGKPADVLDIGTSCGLMAIAAARLGHRVTAVDSVPAMLSYVDMNAKKFGVEIETVLDDMNHLGFDSRKFDLIIAKSCVWMLLEPVKAISRWISLLRPGGHLLIIDGNYYLGHFDRDYARRLEWQRAKNGENQSLHGKTNMDGVNFDDLHKLAMNLPVCAARRPAWDVSVLLALGMKNIRVNSTDSEPFRYVTSSGYVDLTVTFTVLAQAPVMSVREVVVDGPGPMPLLSEHLEPQPEHIKMIKALADANRMKIMNILLISDQNVSSLSGLMGISVSLISHNLKVLKDAGLVRSYKQGKENTFQIINKDAYTEYCQLLGKFC